MTIAKESYPLPSRLTTSARDVRRIGVELEFGGLQLESAAQIVARQFGGHLGEPGRYEREVIGDAAGPWKVELDLKWLKELGRRTRDPNAPLASLEEAGEEALRSAAEWVIPVEVVSPPLSMERLAEVDQLIVNLRDAGAKGTGDALLYAFGLQLNPEMPATDAATILDYLRAFLCLADWLQVRGKIDLTRRLTSFVDPFPKEYVRRVIDQGYQPDLAALIDDYLAFNPTRNRALDFLPLFLYLDPDRVRAAVSDTRVKPRPALHYRLPNCEIDRPEWNLHPIWRDWLQVEHLADERQRLHQVCAAYSEFLDRPLGGLLENWHAKVQPWLKQTGDL